MTVSNGVVRAARPICSLHQAIYISLGRRKYQSIPFNMAVYYINVAFWVGELGQYYNSNDISSVNEKLLVRCFVF